MGYLVIFCKDNPGVVRLTPMGMGKEVKLKQVRRHLKVNGVWQRCQSFFLPEAPSLSPCAPLLQVDFKDKVHEILAPELVDRFMREL